MFNDISDLYLFGISKYVFRSPFRSNILVWMLYPAYYGCGWQNTTMKIIQQDRQCHELKTNFDDDASKIDFFSSVMITIHIKVSCNLINKWKTPTLLEKSHLTTHNRVCVVSFYVTMIQVIIIFWWITFIGKILI